MHDAFTFFCVRDAKDTLVFNSYFACGLPQNVVECL